MSCTLCGTEIAPGRDRCRACGAAVEAAPPKRVDPIAAALARADSVIARAGGDLASFGRLAKGTRRDPVSLLAGAAARISSLGTVPPAVGLPKMTRAPLVMDASLGLSVEVDGPRRGGTGPLQLHYASLHYGESFPHRLVVRNKDFSAIDGVTVSLQVPRYSSRWSRTVGRLARGTPAELEDVRLDVDLDRIRGLVEADTQAHLEVRIDAGGSLRHIESLPVEVLAFREWRYDLTDHPDALACFVQPNDPSLQPVLMAAGSLLAEHFGDSALCGYQKPVDQNWPLLMVMALHHALQATGVRYSNPPASFEAGQKIRLAADVLKGRLGTCLDLAVLWAALLEAVGLHPVLVVVEGHAFQGVWLEPLCCSTPWTSDLDPILAAVLERKLLLFNSTTFTNPEADLGMSIGEAITCLERTPFCALIDVQAARMGGVRPLP